MPDDFQIKQRLDCFIRKQRVHMYKPIQVAEILYRVRLGELSMDDLANRENYRNPSKRWRDEITRRLVGRVSTSSQKFQDNLFEENAVPPSLLKELAIINHLHNGVVERYIYQQFAKRLRVVFQVRQYLQASPDQFSIKEFLSHFSLEDALKRSVDKAYEISVYALLNAVLDELCVSVEISVDSQRLADYPEFHDLVSLLLGLTPELSRRSVPARLFRAGVANAADRGIDMWANFGLVVQVKHITLSEEIAEDVADDTTADEIVIVCRDAEARTIERVASQLGHRIKGIIQESQLVSWYDTAFMPQYASTLGSKTLKNLIREFDEEFPFSRPEYQASFKNFYKERSYDQIQAPDTGCAFFEPDE
jgi:type II restriction enzyme